MICGTSKIWCRIRSCAALPGSVPPIIESITRGRTPRSARPQPVLHHSLSGRCSERLRRRRISRKVSSAHARVKRTFALFVLSLLTEWHISDILSKWRVSTKWHGIFVILSGDPCTGSWALRLSSTSTNNVDQLGFLIAFIDI